MGNILSYFFPPARELPAPAAMSTVEEYRGREVTPAKEVNELQDTLPATEPLQVKDIVVEVPPAEEKTSEPAIQEAEVAEERDDFEVIPEVGTHQETVETIGTIVEDVEAVEAASAFTANTSVSAAGPEAVEDKQTREEDISEVENIEVEEPEVAPSVPPTEPEPRQEREATPLKVTSEVSQEAGEQVPASSKPDREKSPPTEDIVLEVREDITSRAPEVRSSEADKDVEAIGTIQDETLSAAHLVIGTPIVPVEPIPVLDEISEPVVAASISEPATAESEPIELQSEPVATVSEPKISAPVLAQVDSTSTITEITQVVREPTPAVTEPTPAVTEPVSALVEFAPSVSEPAPASQTATTPSLIDPVGTIEDDDDIAASHVDDATTTPLTNGNADHVEEVTVSWGKAASPPPPKEATPPPQKEATPPVQKEATPPVQVSKESTPLKDDDMEVIGSIDDE